MFNKGLNVRGYLSAKRRPPFRIGRLNGRVEPYLRHLAQHLVALLLREQVEKHNPEVSAEEDGVRHAVDVRGGGVGLGGGVRRRHLAKVRGDCAGCQLMLEGGALLRARKL
eukprot:1113034-Prorocentrum_minimum.AAC.1